MAIITPARLIFLDTEFTSLGEPWPVELISAGLAGSAGEPLFYAENDDFDFELTHDFTRARVIPLLERGEKAMPYGALCENFFAAIAALGAPCVLAADSDWDWLWVQMMARRIPRAEGSAMADDPSGFELWPANLSPRMAKINFSALGRADKFASWGASRAHFKDKFPHHALVDAVGNALCAKAAIEANPGRDAARPADFCAVFKQSLPALCWRARAPKPKPSTPSA